MRVFRGMLACGRVSTRSSSLVSEKMLLRGRTPLRECLHDLRGSRLWLPLRPRHSPRRTDRARSSVMQPCPQKREIPSCIKEQNEFGEQNHESGHHGASESRMRAVSSAAYSRWKRETALEARCAWTSSSPARGRLAVRAVGRAGYGAWFCYTKALKRFVCAHG